MFDLVNEIMSERSRQIREEGFDHAHDDSHYDGELAWNAAALVLDFVSNDARRYDDWGLAEKHRGDRRRQLVIAAALIVAEIERMDRARAALGGRDA